MGGSRSEVNRSEGQSVSRDEDARLRIGGGGGNEILWVDQGLKNHSG